MDFKIKIVDDNSFTWSQSGFMLIFGAFFGSIPTQMLLDLVNNTGKVINEQTGQPETLNISSIFFFGMFILIGYGTIVLTLISIIKNVNKMRKLKHARTISAPYEFTITDAEDTDMRTNDIPHLRLTLEGDAGLYVAEIRTQVAPFYRYLNAVDEGAKPVRLLGYLLGNTIYMSENEIVSKVARFRSKYKPRHKTIE